MSQDMRAFVSAAAYANHLHQQHGANMKAHINFEIYWPKRLLAISDKNDGAMSITNDAEAVVAWAHDCGYLGYGERFIYSDTDGRWDELKHDGAGKFTGFAHLGAASFEAAVKAVLFDTARAS